jgi:hypothetical protein
MTPNRNNKIKFKQITDLEQNDFSEIISKD